MQACVENVCQCKFLPAGYQVVAQLFALCLPSPSARWLEFKFILIIYLKYVWCKKWACHHHLPVEQLHSKKYKTCSYNIPSHRKTPCSLLRPLQRMSLVEKPVVKSSQKKSLLLYQDKTFVVVPAALALPRLDPHLPFSMQLDALQPHNFVKHLPTQPISSELQMDTNLLVRPELFI